MELLEQIAHTASFNGGLVNPGQDGSGWDTKSVFNVDGYASARRKLALKHKLQVAEAATLWGKFLKGDINPFLMMEAIKGGTEDWVFPKLNSLAPTIFNEAMTRGDFTNLTTFVLDRQLYENYAAYPKTYTEVCKVNPNIKDFRAVERWQVDGGEDPWQKVGELANFNRTSEKTGKYGYQVYKYEKGAQISWEAVINDDMGQFTDLPRRVTMGGIRTIEQYWLSLIAGATGPNSSFYGTAISLVTGGTIKNIIDLSAYTTGTFTGTNNPVLNVINLIMSVGLFMNQMTAEGRPIDIASDELVVLVADGILYQTLLNIINTNMIVSTVLGGTKASGAVSADLALQAKNWISGRIRPVYAPELRNIVTTNAATSWWIFAKPGTGKPAIELGFLSGYEAPQLYRKLPNTARIGGGGAVDVFGDFETMSTEFKGLIVFGGTRMDPRTTMASNGTGS